MRQSLHDYDCCSTLTPTISHSQHSLTSLSDTVWPSVMRGAAGHSIVTSTTFVLMLPILSCRVCRDLRLTMSHFYCFTIVYSRLHLLRRELCSSWCFLVWFTLSKYYAFHAAPSHNLFIENCLYMSRIKGNMGQHVYYCNWNKFFLTSYSHQRQKILLVGICSWPS